MKLIVGLGNPGSKYMMTRHNIGFMAADHFNNSFGDGQYKKEHKAEIAKIRVGSNQILIAKPQTFMNLSGESVQKIMSFYDVEPENILVIHDEIEIPFLSIRYQTARGHGGHNGIRNIHQMLSSNKYDRLRLGVGRPENPKMDVASYVLQNFLDIEVEELKDYLDTVSKSLETYICDGFQKAATNFNFVKGK
ncbi:MAG: aminoacyl-tRNA hydrolase [Bdellovibrionaceae bacterium]|jgi:peptidyl-tRNA hydrolase, PTH1 family|nr:aminoacyl-tRNA hydrolase [Pseudobdellovibrionaceae bacterium]